MRKRATAFFVFVVARYLAIVVGFVSLKTVILGIAENDFPRRRE
jgi:hypothetical protein